MRFGRKRRSRISDSYLHQQVEESSATDPLATYSGGVLPSFIYVSDFREEPLQNGSVPSYPAIKDQLPKLLKTGAAKSKMNLSCTEYTEKA